MTDVFFSYASKDRDRVRPAHDALEAAGFDVFWDVMVPTAADWERLIKLRLEQARVVVVFWTRNSASSENVKYEVGIARDMGKLVQVMLEEVPSLELPMGANSEQAAQLSKWRGEVADAEWTKLVRAIEFKATPPWLRRKLSEKDVSLKAEQDRRAEADARVRALEDAHAKEVQAQGDLRRERDRLADQLQIRESKVFDLTEQLAAARAPIIGNVGATSKAMPAGHYGGATARRPTRATKGLADRISDALLVAAPAASLALLLLFLGRRRLDLPQITFEYGLLIPLVLVLVMSATSSAASRRQGFFAAVLLILVPLGAAILLPLYVPIIVFGWSLFEVLPLLAALWMGILTAVALDDL